MESIARPPRAGADLRSLRTRETRPRTIRLSTAAALLAAVSLLPFLAAPAAGQMTEHPADVRGTADSTGTPGSVDLFDILKQVILKRRIEPQLAGELQTGLSWSVLPSVGYNPTFGFAAGASASGAGRLSRREDDKISRLWAGANYSTTGQFQAESRGSLFLAGGDFLTSLDVRYLDTSRSTWGLGPISHPGNEEEYAIDYRMIRTYVTVYSRIEGPIYGGFGYHLDTFRDIVDERARAGEPTPYLDYTGSLLPRVQSGGLSMNLMADARDNAVNPRSGYLLSATFRSYQPKLGADWNWQEMQLEFRTYPRIPPRSRNRLAFWILTWFTFGDPPYLNLPYVGGDTYGRSGRGYLQGRIRSRDLVYGEAEYRFDLTRNGLLGAVVFANATNTTDPDSGIFGRADWAGGAGLRIKFNKKNDTNLAIDFGKGKEGSSGVFLGMSEVF